jgi:hypothetical protein
LCATILSKLTKLNKINIQKSNMSVVWTLAMTVAYVDGSKLEISLVKDSDDPYRQIGGVDLTSLNGLNQVQSFNDFFNAISSPTSYSPPPGTPPDDVVSLVFRFQAITTNGHINVLGGSDNLDTQIITNDLIAVMTDLNTDSDFFSVFSSLSGVVRF